MSLSRPCRLLLPAGMSSAHCDSLLPAVLSTQEPHTPTVQTPRPSASLERARSRRASRNRTCGGTRGAAEGMEDVRTATSNALVTTDDGPTPDNAPSPPPQPPEEREPAWEGEGRPGGPVVPRRGHPRGGSPTKRQRIGNKWPKERPLGKNPRGRKPLWYLSDPAGTRTQDLRIKSPLLYQLSYRVGHVLSSGNAPIYGQRDHRVAGLPRASVAQNLEASLHTPLSRVHHLHIGREVVRGSKTGVWSTRGSPWGGPRAGQRGGSLR
jgi:hypothetical protein